MLIIRQYQNVPDPWPPAVEVGAVACTCWFRPATVRSYRAYISLTILLSILCNSTYAKSPRVS